MVVLLTVMSTCGSFIHWYVQVPGRCSSYPYVHPVVVSVVVCCMGLLYVCVHGHSPVWNPGVSPLRYMFLYVHVHNICSCISHIRDKTVQGTHTHVKGETPGFSHVFNVCVLLYFV